MTASRRDLVLVGGGHAHVQVLRSFEMRPRPGTRLTLVVDVPVAVYSGMVPGFVAGQYTAADLEIDCVPLARRAGARVILAPALRVDSAARRIEIEGRAPIAYDVASFDVGSTVVGLGLPGVREHALPTRPIALFVRRIDEVTERMARLPSAETRRVAVVGGGAGGVEVAFCIEQRLREAGLAAEIDLLHNSDRVLAGYPVALTRKVERAASRRGIRIRNRVTVEAAEPEAVVLTNGERVPCSALLWVTGAASHPLLAESNLPVDSRGFVRVRPTLQVNGHEDLFAVGDCAHLEEHPETPKAGVYAVRQGPYVDANLRSFLDGRSLRRYVPQSDFLALLNLGDGTALGVKWGFSFEGKWVMRLKDRIDRSFMRRFQVLAPDGALTPTFSEPAMAGRPMLCGGCAAKVGQSVLERALRRVGESSPPAPWVALGLETPDDAAAWYPALASDGEADGADAEAGAGRRKGPLVVTSVDAFRAFTDDPWSVGRIAAVNALNDLYATGAEPRLAQALVQAPEEADADDQEELLFQVLAGARSIFDPLSVPLVGGHTTTGPELVVGFAVDGTARDESDLLRLDGAREGDQILLTKPVGTGVLFHADALGRARGPWIGGALQSMGQPARAGVRLAREARCSAVTDVTGFGLAGHLGEMMRASGVTASLELGAIPVLDGVMELLSQGLRSTSHEENARARSSIAVPEDLSADLRLELLFDPQTAGGLLLTVASESADSLLERLRAEGAPLASRIGEAIPRREDGVLIEVRPPHSSD